MMLLSKAAAVVPTLWILLFCIRDCFSEIRIKPVNTTNLNTVVPDSPRFVVRLPDRNLLCFSIEGYELFTYNLITSNYLVLNAFLNLTSVEDDVESINPSETKLTRGFSDIGIIVKAVDKRVKVGKRLFKHVIYGSKKKAVMESFGEVDMSKGSVTFNLERGHSNIQSQESDHEKFRVLLDKPQSDIVAIASNGRTYSVYVEDCTGLLAIDVHGLIGQFFHSKVRISAIRNELTRSDGVSVPIELGTVWDSVKDEGYLGEKCWYPKDGASVIQGETWQYVVEHLLATPYKYSLFKP